MNEFSDLEGWLLCLLGLIYVSYVGYLFIQMIRIWWK